MSSRYHGPMRYMGDFKAVAIDYEYYLTLSDKPQSVCLTERQMYVLTVQNTYTFWPTRWYNIEDTSKAELQLIAAEIEDLLMCGCGIPEPTLTDRFNTINYSTATNTIYQDTYNTWNDSGQTVVSIAPNLDWDTGSHPDIDRVNCLNIGMFVKTIVDTALATRQGDFEHGLDIVTGIRNVLAALAATGGAVLASGGALAALAAFFLGPELVIGLAISAVIAGVVGLLASMGQETLNDADAIEQIRCTLVQNIIGKQLTRAVFQAGLDPNDFAPGSHAAEWAALFQPFLDDINVYLQFLTTGNGIYDNVDTGALPECEECPVVEEPRYPLHSLDTFSGQIGTFVGWGAGEDSDYDVWSFTPFYNGSDLHDGYQYGVSIYLAPNESGPDYPSYPFSIVDVSGMAEGYAYRAPGAFTNEAHFEGTAGAAYWAVGMFRSSDGPIVFMIKPRP